MSTNDTMNSLIRAAARRDEAERGPQPQWSTPSDQPRRVDVNAVVLGGEMPVEPNANAIADWHRQYGYTAATADPISALREAVAEKRLGRYPGFS